MHIRTVFVENIKCIPRLRWFLPSRQLAGWHVIIGDNGSGKSTLLRAIALALVGPSEAAALREKWSDWLRKGRRSGEISLVLKSDPKYDKYAGKGRQASKTALHARLSLWRNESDVVLEKIARPLDPDRTVWSGKAGWFSASYGPFRRFAGGDKEREKMFYSSPRLAAHLSLFSESVALTESLGWLQGLQFKKLERKRPETVLLERITKFVNQEGFLPHGARLHRVTSDEVVFVDGNQCELPIEGLSDGYRSILSLTFELIRQMAKAYGPDNVFSTDDPPTITTPGVVLIDEVDAHLHPTWQRQIGGWFCRNFPNVQFIVSTHSPLICQAASLGSVWRLPKPGSTELGAQVKGIELDRLVYGNVLDAYSTDLFGSDVSRSDESKRKLHRLAELNLRELTGKLSQGERAEQEQLRATMPTAANSLDNKRAS